jgi:chemotaxis protein histidine kinase CheA
MSSLWHYTRESLDQSLSAIHESLGNLKAAKPVDTGALIQNFESAAESARNLRSLVSSEIPDASWQTRDELENLLNKIEVIREIKARRSRLLDLAAGLQRGSVVHRRAARVEQVNQLRDNAIQELRSLAESDEAPPPLPGPDPDQWIGWASNLQEPQDSESLKTLRSSFAQLDAFVAHLEPEMWRASAETSY